MMWLSITCMAIVIALTFWGVLTTSFRVNYRNESIIGTGHLGIFQ